MPLTPDCGLINIANVVDWQDDQPGPLSAPSRDFMVLKIQVQSGRMGAQKNGVEAGDISPWTRTTFYGVESVAE